MRLRANIGQILNATFNRPSYLHAPAVSLLVLRTVATVLCLIAASRLSLAAEQTIGEFQFTMPDGMQLELIAGPPLVERPICVDFDEQGRLYVAESSGSNDPVEKQLEEKPHRILRLEDTDGDGVFDERVVVADRIMFPEGILWHDGSVYVAAPPSIWKLTDHDGDGVAEEQIEWFQGKTLTHCANDLHGPYRGPDGWIYWCKGAFAEQTYERPGKEPFITRASHIFRRSPDESLIEPVMTGGMDNPVEVAFSPEGERFFSTTFFQYPANGQRDGLIHAIYGGVYGKDHGVLEGHTRTGELMPVLTHLGAAAPCGLTMLRSNHLGAGHAGSLVTARFNMQKVTLSQLTPDGGSFTAKNSDLLVCDSLDFHPTDVIEDADGTLLIVNTGGWYKLCCPTSQLWKPDLLGGIYRLRKTDSPRAKDSRGRELDWEKADVATLAQRLEDGRPAVCERAVKELAERGAAAVPVVTKALHDSGSVLARIHAVWVLSRIGTPPARKAIRAALQDENERVRQAAGHAVSLARDADAFPELLTLLQSHSAWNRRVAAQGLGRIGNPKAVPALLSALDGHPDRAVEHALIYAVIEIGDAQAVRQQLADASPSVTAGGLIALDQMPGTPIAAEDVLPRLNSEDARLREAARWVTAHHPDWGTALAHELSTSLANLTPQRRKELTPLLQQLLSSEPIQQMFARYFESGTDSALLEWALETVSGGTLKALPRAWEKPLGKLLSADTDVPAIVSLVSGIKLDPQADELSATLREIAESAEYDPQVRLAAAEVAGLPDRRLGAALFDLVLQCVPNGQTTSLRSLAADLIAGARLSPEQADRLLARLPEVGPLEMQRVVTGLAKSLKGEDALKLIQALQSSSAIVSVLQDKLEKLFAGHDAQVRQAAIALIKHIAQEQTRQQSQLNDILTELPEGDVRRGQVIFHSEKIACKACHSIGYLGGKIGPDLTRIARIRSKRDLLEAVLFPSKSFVQNFEPMMVVTTDGRIFTGLVQDAGGNEIVITTTERKEIRVSRSEVELIQPGKVSIMPAGLEKQMTQQELADLLAFLLSRK